jgi:hypothetical protein
MMNDEKFLHAFQAAAWPADDWHHREHVKIAYLYLRQYPFDVALDRVRSGILALNAAQNVPDEPNRGYHETMTHAWLQLVHVTLCEFGPSESADAFVDTHAQLLSKRALWLFYSQDRLLSAEAKQSFIVPDLAALPTSKKSKST